MVTGMDKRLDFAEYLYEDDVGKKYTVIEAYPDNKEPKLEEIGMNKIRWEFLCGTSFLPHVIEKSAKFRNKHVFLVPSKEKDKVAVGFHPRLTSKQRDVIKSMVVDSTPDM